VRLRNSPRLSWLVMAVLAAQPAYASFHFMQIEQVMGGVDGDPSAQAIQLRMRSLGQNLLMAARIRAWDAQGQNPVLIIDFPTSVPNGAAGARVLIATQSFADRTTPVAVPDFFMANLIPESYLVAGSLTYEEADSNVIYWRLSWGGAAYSGDTTGDTLNDDDPGSEPADFGPPFADPLPSACNRALQFQGPHWALSTSNAADYALTTATAVFFNNADTQFSAPATCFSDDECDDGVACTDDHCVAGCCLFTCSDGDPCTENDECVMGICTGTPVDCSYLDGTCRVGVCNATTGTCEVLPANEGGECDDSNACTLSDVCTVGNCLGTMVDCSHLNTTCNAGVCNPATGICQQQPANEGGPCDDGQFCTATDRCAAGMCTGSGNPCTPPQQCDEANDLCVGCLSDAECADGNPCTDDACVNGDCRSQNNLAPCDDEDSCTVDDQCSGGACAGDPVDCSKLNDACNTGECDPATGDCERLPANEGGPCNDGLFCTPTDSCHTGVCVGAGNPCPPPLQCDEAEDRCVECFIDAACDDGNPCTDDACPDGQCQNIDNSSACDDADPCTVNDMCSAGACMGTMVDCSSLDNACNVGLCNRVSGICEPAPANEGGPCNDGLFCTVLDRCQNGLCVGSGNPCVPPLQCDEATDRCVECFTHADCDDANFCTDDDCQDGFCQITPNMIPCNDGNACTGNDRCQGGTCAGTPVDCSALNTICRLGACNSISGACQPVPINEGGLCNDGLFCTAIDACHNGICQGTGDPCPPPQQCDEATDRCLNCLTNEDCDDGIACTNDACVSGECVFTPDHAKCSDNGVFCDGIAACDTAAGCTVSGPCSPGQTCFEEERLCVPALSGWGIGLMAILLFAGGLVIMRHRLLKT